MAKKKGAAAGRKTELVRVYSDTAKIMRDFKREFRVPLIHLYEKAVTEWADAGPEFDVPYGTTPEDRAEIARAKSKLDT